MKPYSKFLFILWTFIAGCAAGGFDITQPLITLVPEPREEATERVYWVPYNDEEVDSLLEATDRCVFFYFKTELSCKECDILDNSLKDKHVVSLLNEHFISYKITDDMADFQKGLDSLKGDIDNLPYIIIVQTNPLKVLGNHSGFISTTELIRIINNTLNRCY